jgi:hypothetical protein
VSVKEVVEHCVEQSIEQPSKTDYDIEEYQDNENTVVLHGSKALLTPELTEELRKRLIFVDATGSMNDSEHEMMYFLHYLEPEEDTFIDQLANPLSTENTGGDE